MSLPIVIGKKHSKLDSDWQNIVMKASKHYATWDPYYDSPRVKKIESIKNRITIENRQGKIESIINDSFFEEKRIEDDEEYQSLLFISSRYADRTNNNNSNNIFIVDYISLLK